MLSLDHKIPPPVIALICAALAWILAHLTPGLSYLVPARIPIIVLLVLIGLALDISGLMSFRKAKTTFNPLAPGRSKSIVQNGPYQFTRNPMYLGMVFNLLGLCVYFENPLTWLRSSFLLRTSRASRSSRKNESSWRNLVTLTRSTHDLSGAGSDGSQYDHYRPLQSCGKWRT